jgi:hypothetical protein
MLKLHAPHKESVNGNLLMFWKPARPRCVLLTLVAILEIDILVESLDPGHRLLVIFLRSHPDSHPCLDVLAIADTAVTGQFDICS